jgi:hypothetical protein
VPIESKSRRQSGKPAIGADQAGAEPEGPHKELAIVPSPSLPYESLVLLPKILMKQIRA